MTQNSILRFNNLSQIPGIVHGFSTRTYGSMKSEDAGSDDAFELFSSALKINPGHVIKMQQIHSNNVDWVTRKERGLRISKTDGLLTKEKDVFLSVMSADCIPLLMFDRKKRYAGVVHAGWKGIKNEIIKAAVDQLISRGSNPADVLVGIGPCIRSCCYNIGKERAMLFDKEFVCERDGSKFLDLPKIAKKQLISSGIPVENIEDSGLCTLDNPEKFFSYRKEGEKAGRFAGIIGMI